MPTETRSTVSAAGLRSIVAALFARTGLSGDASDRMAAALVEADQQGVGTHGVAMAPNYIERLERGSVRPAETATVVQDRDAVVVLDAGHMFGHLAADQAMAMAIVKAKRFGLGAVAVRHAFHFGMAARYAVQATQEGCIGVAMCNTRPMMAAPGGLRPLVGNNPLSIATPSESGVPIVLDMAMSEVALAKIRAAARRGEPIPQGWAVGTDGAPTTDAQAALAGMLSPAAGGKGFALALLVDVLSGVLSGGGWGDGVKPLFGDLDQPNDCAFLFLALHVDHFRALDDFLGDVQTLGDGVAASPTVTGAPARIPGAARAALAARQTEFVEVDVAVLEQLRQFAAKRGADLSALDSTLIRQTRSPA